MKVGDRSVFFAEEWVGGATTFCGSKSSSWKRLEKSQGMKRHEDV